MNEDILFELVKQVGLFAIVLSVVIGGIKKTIKVFMKIPETEKLSPYVGICMVYIFGLLLGFILQNEYVSTLWHKILFGFFIGAMTVEIYDDVIKYLRVVFRKLSEKVFGVNDGCEK